MKAVVRIQALWPFIATECHSPQQELQTAPSCAGTHDEGNPLAVLKCWYLVMSPSSVPLSHAPVFFARLVRPTIITMPP